MKRTSRLIVALSLLSTLLVISPAAAEPIGLNSFIRTWERTDKPVADHRTNRTWMWGPEPFSGVIDEPFADAPGGSRRVQYFDKSRMEDNAYENPTAPWDVTNGLLAKELVTGEVQTGKNNFLPGEPAQINVAGDTNDPQGPTYATYAGLMEYAPIPEGWTITQTVDRAGTIGSNENLAGYGVTATHLVDVPGISHRIASVFWEFMNSSGMVYENGQFVNAQLFENAYYATGYPLTEAYWTSVQVAGVPKTVLVQVFERRVLTYTPDNPDGWKVEAGNVGQHYYQWRYGNTEPPTQSPPPASGTPEEGGILYQSSLADWPTQADEFGNGGVWLPEENGYLILTYPGEVFIAVGPGLPTYADASYSVDLWGYTGMGDSSGCLTIRVSDPGAYFVCLMFDASASHGTLAFYLDLTATGEESFQELGSFPFSVPSPAAQTYNLKVIAQGNQFWFLIDGALVGTATHSGASSGYVGLAGFNIDEVTESIIGFRNLVIRSIGSGGGTTPPPAPPSVTCDPAYPGVCIPPKAQVGDLDCDDISYRNFQALPPDPHGFDGNNDGIGCEGN